MRGRAPDDLSVSAGILSFTGTAPLELGIVAMGVVGLFVSHRAKRVHPPVLTFDDRAVRHTGVEDVEDRILEVLLDVRHPLFGDQVFQ